MVYPIPAYINFTYLFLYYFRIIISMKAMNILRYLTVASRLFSYTDPMTIFQH